MKACQQCGIQFQPKEDRPSRPAKYCSRACRDAAQRTLVDLVCRQCGTVFRRKAYMKDWSQERGPFCGFECYGAWQKQNTAGPASPTYKASVNRQGSDFRHARQKALERDGHRCVDCGKEGRLHVHHIEDPDNHELDNLVTLCARCHVARHPDRNQPSRGPNGRYQTIS